jgi:hypothetical protein
VTLVKVTSRHIGTTGAAVMNKKAKNDSWLQRKHFITVT